VCQKPYFDFIRSLPNPTGLFLVYYLPQRTPFVLEIGPNVLYPIIERLLGGKGASSPPPGRPPTRIEQALGRTVATRILTTLTDTWRNADPARELPASSSGARFDEACDAAAPRLDLAEVEHNPLLMQIVGPAEPTVVLSFQATIRLEGALTGQFHLCLPTTPFESVLEAMVRARASSGQADPQSREAREQILARVEESTIQVAAELASVPVALPDLLALRPGDVLDLATGRDAEAALCVDGRRTPLGGRPVTRNGRRALRITSVGITSIGEGPADPSDGPEKN